MPNRPVRQGVHGPGSCEAEPYPGLTQIILEKQAHTWTKPNLAYLKHVRPESGHLVNWARL